MMPEKVTSFNHAHARSVSCGKGIYENLDEIKDIGTHIIQQMVVFIDGGNEFRR